jgi:hypothetical protein
MEKRKNRIDFQRNFARFLTNFDLRKGFGIFGGEYPYISKRGNPFEPFYPNPFASLAKYN